MHGTARSAALPFQQCPCIVLIYAGDTCKDQGFGIDLSMCRRIGKQDDKGLVAHQRAEGVDAMMNHGKGGMAPLKVSVWFDNIRQCLYTDLGGGNTPVCVLLVVSTPSLRCCASNNCQTLATIILVTATKGCPIDHSNSSILHCQLSPDRSS